ncbi:MAG: hypothetical protein K2X87_33640 [Gemmataceae bacterium]|nr:hypothetical protein [Gemmataceae bacterium]
MMVRSFLTAAAALGLAAPGYAFHPFHLCCHHHHYQGGTVSGGLVAGNTLVQPANGLVLTQPSAGLVLTQPSAGLMLTQPSAGLVLTQPSAGLVWTQPSAGLGTPPFVNQPTAGGAGTTADLGAGNVLDLLRFGCRLLNLIDRRGGLAPGALAPAAGESAALTQLRQRHQEELILMGINQERKARGLEPLALPPAPKDGAGPMGAAPAAAPRLATVDRNLDEIAVLQRHLAAPSAARRTTPPGRDAVAGR